MTKKKMELQTFEIQRQATLYKSERDQLKLSGDNQKVMKMKAKMTQLENDLERMSTQTISRRASPAVSRNQSFNAEVTPKH